jgi:hypothetical protein
MKLYDLYENRIASCVWTAWQDGKRETHCASPEDKAAAVALEKRGLAVVRRTDVLCGGWAEWWVRFTPNGAIAYEGVLLARREAIRVAS